MITLKGAPPYAVGIWIVSKQLDAVSTHRKHSRLPYAKLRPLLPSILFPHTGLVHAWFGEARSRSEQVATAREVHEY